LEQAVPVFYLSKHYMSFYNIEPDQVNQLEDILSQGNDTLMRWHSPNCGHCTAMEQVWREELPNKVKDMKIPIDIIDADVSLTSQLQHKAASHMVKPQPKGVPTIIYFKANGDSLQEYDGERTAEGISSWINSLTPQSGGMRGKARKRKASIMKSRSKKRTRNANKRSVKLVSITPARSVRKAKRSKRFRGTKRRKNARGKKRTKGTRRR
jgi:hypothetical protein